MRRYLSGIMLGIIVLISACSRDVQTQKYVDTSDLKNFRTYAWLPAGDTVWNDFEKDAVVSEEIRNRINKELQEVGYTMDAENPDFLVLVHTTYDTEIDLQQLPSSYNYYGPGFYTGTWGSWGTYYYPNYHTIGYVYGPQISAVEYTEGRIVIDLIDRRNNEIVWRGTSRDAIYDDELMEEMAEEVDHIFDEFPVEDI